MFRSIKDTMLALTVFLLVGAINLVSKNRGHQSPQHCSVLGQYCSLNLLFRSIYKNPKSSILHFLFELYSNIFSPYLLCYSILYVLSIKYILYA